MKSIAEVVGLVLLGFIKRDDFAKEIQDRTLILPGTADGIAKMLGKTVLNPLQSDLDKVYNPLPTAQVAQQAIKLEEIRSATMPASKPSSALPAREPAAKPLDVQNLAIKEGALNPFAPEHQTVSVPAYVPSSAIKSPSSPATQQASDKAVVLQEERVANPVVFQNDFLKGFTGTDFSVGKVDNLIRSTPTPQPPAKPAQVDFGGVKRDVSLQNAPKVINYRAPNVMEKLSPPPMPPRIPLSELVVPPASPAQATPPQPIQPAPHNPTEPVRF
jgi:hypothetical protein